MPKKKVHWTQTPEGRKRWAMIRKRADKARKGKPTTKKEEPSNDGSRDEIDEGTFAYALGHVECWIEVYATSARVSAVALAAQLGKILQSKANR